MANCVLPWIQLLSSCYRCYAVGGQNWKCFPGLLTSRWTGTQRTSCAEDTEASSLKSTLWKNKRRWWRNRDRENIGEQRNSSGWAWLIGKCLMISNSTVLHIYIYLEKLNPCRWIISWSWLGNVRANGCWSLLERDQASLIGRGIEIFFESLTPMFLTHQNVILEGFNPQQQTPPSNLNKSGLFKQFLPKISCKDFAFKGQICKETLNW